MEIGDRIRQAALSHEPVWSDTDGEAMRAGIAGKIKRSDARRRMARGASGGLLVLALGVSGLQRAGWWSSGRPDIRETVARAVPTPIVTPLPVAQAPEGLPPQAPLQLFDGSKVTPLHARTRLSVATAEQARPPGAPRVALEAGAARFEVTPQLNGTFRIAAGAVSVEVLGTVFTVERLDGGTPAPGARVRVAVEEGRVRIGWAGPDGMHQEQLLIGGDSGTFPPDVAPRPAAPGGGGPKARSGGGAGWRSLAVAGHYDDAYAALSGSPSEVRDEPNDLMLAADVARLSRHPEKAVAPLRRLLARHGRDDRAAPGAFLLGRILIESLDRPQEAARAFAQARALSPDGPLTEDALAREITARAKIGTIGERDTARVLAQKYLADYPRGERAHEIRRFAE